MTNFKLNIDDRAFENVGVQVQFDDERYKQLIDELAPGQPANNIPRIELAPAVKWGMPKFNYLLHVAAGNYEIEPRGYYLPSKRSIDINASEDTSATNIMLLGNTRRWAGHVNGELDRHRKDLADGMGQRMSKRTAGAAMGVILGIDLAHTDKNVFGIMGALIGFAGGSALSSYEIYRSSYNRRLRDFVKDPEVVGKYGKIISYSQI
jgi:hypothetical protein